MCKMGHISSPPLIVVRDFLSEYKTDHIISITENSLKLSQASNKLMIYKSGFQVGDAVLKLVLDLENILRSCALFFRCLENM